MLLMQNVLKFGDQLKTNDNKIEISYKQKKK